MFNALMAFARRLSSIGSYRTSYSRSERDLAIRGISRDGLVRSHINGLGLR